MKAGKISCDMSCDNKALHFEEAVLANRTDRKHARARTHTHTRRLIRQLTSAV